MKILIICFSVIWAVPCLGLVGDLDADGPVGFQDFFIFADHFGEIGPATGNDCVSIISDTVTVLNPIVGKYDTWSDVYEEISLFNPWEGLRSTSVRETTDKFRLGPDLSFIEHTLVELQYYEDGQTHLVNYLKPSGHVFTDKVWEKSRIDDIRRLEDGTIEAYVKIGNLHTTFRYLYNEDMEVIEVQEEEGEHGYGFKYFYFEELETPGHFSVSCADNRTDIPRVDWCAPMLDGTWTYEEFDMDSLLGR